MANPRILDAYGVPFQRRSSGWSKALLPFRNPQTAAAVATVIASIVLAWVTWSYVRLTGRLVRLQSDPVLEAGFDPFHTGTVLELKNSGQQPVVGVGVFLKTTVFRDLNKPPIMTSSVGLSSPGSRRPWWNVSQLLPDQPPVSRDLSEPLRAFLQHVDATQETEEIQAKIQHRPPDRSPLTAVLTIDVLYRREVDGRQYRLSLSGFLDRDA